MQIKKSKNKIYILNNLYMKEILIYLLKTNLLIQDMSLDTPLHKLAKFNDKLFFIKIFLKLNEIGLLFNELLSLINIDYKNICQYIFEEIKNKFKSLLINDNDYYKFANLIKISYPNIFNKLDYKTKKIINEYITKNKYDNYIFYPFTSGINFLNCLY